MTDQELTGTSVLVHPLLWDDPAERNGQIGTIVDADISRDDFTVRFDDDSQALYSSNALLIPKSGHRVYDCAVIHQAAISHELRQVLADYANHIDYYGADAQKGALKLVQANENLQVFLTDSLEEMLGLKPSYRIGR